MRVSPAKRGAVLDRNGVVLALTARVYEVGVDPLYAREEDREKLISLCHYLERSYQDLVALWEDSIKGPKRWIKLADSVSEETYEKIQKLGVRGVYGNPRDRRIYTGSPSFGPILGFLNRENVPVCGIERLFHFYLKGQDGLRESEKDGRRREMAQFRKRSVPCRHGFQVQLTLDAHIQTIVEGILQEAFDHCRPLSIQAIVTQPHSGSLLASVTLPGFDANRYWDFPSDCLKNRIVTDVYEPGSVFKVITVGAALNERVITPETPFDCGKTTVEYGNKTLSLPNDWKPYNKVMPVKDILSQSSNRGVAQIGLLLGHEKLYQYARFFGFGEKTGGDFGGESRGRLIPWKKWDDVSLTRIPIGHGVACTLLQMHYAVSALANRGKLQFPHYVERVFDAQGNIVHSFLPRTRRRVVTEETAQCLCRLMLQKPTSKAYIEGYNVAAKTGTSQKIIGGKYSHSKHISSISGFFPQDIKRVHISLTIDSPQVGGTAYGAQVAAPIFKKMADAIIGYLRIPPEPQRV
jgi:cell division protein FtsI/penicillin-binding protein 2